MGYLNIKKRCNPNVRDMEDPDLQAAAQANPPTLYSRTCSISLWNNLLKEIAFYKDKQYVNNVNIRYCIPSVTRISFLAFVHSMQTSESTISLIDPAEDLTLLHPCFRFKEVKLALEHIASRIGLTLILRPENPYIFFYSMRAHRLAIMITPMRFNADQMCYGFQAVFIESFALPVHSGLKSTSGSSTWHVTPSSLYLELLQSLKLSDVKHIVESFAAKGLLPEHSSYLEPLKTSDHSNIEYSWQDLDLLNTLEINGFPTPTYSEFTSLLFWNIKPVYLEQLATGGYNYFSVHEIGVVWRNKIPTSYLEGLANAGYGRFSAEEYATLYASQVTPSSVQILANQGYTNLSMLELVRMIQYGSCRLLPSHSASNRP